MYFYDLDEVSQMIGITRSTAKTKACRFGIPSLHVGHKAYYNETDLELFRDPLGNYRKDTKPKASRRSYAKACNTDCAAYAAGTCRFMPAEKTECPRIRQIYK